MEMLGGMACKMEREEEEEGCAASSSVPPKTFREKPCKRFSPFGPPCGTTFVAEDRCELVLVADCSERAASASLSSPLAASNSDGGASTDGLQRLLSASPLWSSMALTNFLLPVGRVCLLDDV